MILSLCFFSLFLGHFVNLDGDYDGTKELRLYSICVYVCEQREEFKVIRRVRLVFVLYLCAVCLSALGRLCMCCVVCDSIVKISPLVVIVVPLGCLVCL